MGSNNFDGPVIIDTVDTTALTAYFGFGRAAGAIVASGPAVGSLNVDPSAGAGVAAELGSLILRRDAGNVAIWQKTTAPDTGWSQAGSLSGSVTLTGLSSTGTPAFQWTMADNTAAAVSMGAAGALNMLVFDTSNAAEHLIVNAASGLWMADNAELAFGTPGTDLVLTPDGTDVQVTGTGVLQFANSVITRYGTTSATAGEILGDAVALRIRTRAISGVVTASNALIIGTGTTDPAAAIGGGNSGAVTIGSGATDTSNAGGQAGNSGSVNLQSGVATSSVGVLSGATGIVTIRSGDSTDGASGDVVITTGSAATTRGVLDINSATVDYATQATNNLIIDNSATAFRIQQSTNLQIGIDTTDAAEAITFGNTTTNPQVNFTTNRPIVTDGIDHGTRLVLNEQFDQRPAIAADIANTNASKTWEAAGTNATSALVVFTQGGGVQVTTAGANNDQICLVPNTVGADNSQSPWKGCGWNTSNSPKLKATIRVRDTATAMIVAGFKITTTLDLGTDADQVFIGYNSAGTLGGVAANWIARLSASNVDSLVDTGIAVAAGTVRLVIDVDSSRVPRIYINGVLGATLGAMTAGVVTMWPIVAIQALAGVARVMNVCRVSGSMVYSD